MAGLPSASSFLQARSSRQLNTTPQLPNGQCSFRDLALGPSSQTCGCRRFWLNNAPAAASSLRQSDLSLETAWCFCGHHACYHDFLQDTSAAPSGPAPLQQSHHVSHTVVPAQTSHNNGHYAPGLGLYLGQDKHNRPLAPNVAESIPSMPLTVYNSKLPSQEPSTPRRQISRQSPSRAFLSYVESQRRPAPTVDTTSQHPAEQKEDYLQSATEVATPSLCGTPALRVADDELDRTRSCVDAIIENAHAGSPSARSQRNAAQLPTQLSRPADTQDRALLSEQLVSHVQALKHILSSRPGLLTSIADLDKRMDALENVSFAHGSVDDLHDRFEHFDARLLEIEGKVDELEKLRSSFDHKHDSAAKATESFDSEMSDANVRQPPARLGLDQAKRLQELEQRLADLEDTGSPTALHPWDIEVVLLPWGHDLKGIWSSDAESVQPSKPSSEESSNLAVQTGNSRDPSPSVNSRSASRSQNAAEWPGTDKSLLWARACGATSGSGGRVYQRLKSRGFVRNISIVGSDARRIYMAICEAFGELLHFDSASSVGSEASNLSAQRYPLLLAFQSLFVPLRKVHKFSRLRFLSTPELATPLLWSSDFLDSDVFMKAPAAGLRRLFITTPGAYTQSIKQRGWTWQKIRELPRTDLVGSSEVLEGDANEPCWMFDPKLDTTPPSVHSSFASKDSFEKHPSFDSSHPLSPEKTEWSSGSEAEYEPEHRDDTAEQPRVQTRSHVAPITPLSDMPPTLMRRTVSLPISTQSETPKRLVSRRECLSFEQAPPRAPTKRPRASPSPDDYAPAIRGRWAMTPRRSREPTSPSARTRSSGVAEPQESAPADVIVRKRGPTPSAYATPFSNSFAPISSLGNSWEAGDTDMDSSSSDDDDDDDDMAELEKPSKGFGEAQAADRAFDRAVMMEEEGWEGVGGDAPDDDDDDQHDRHAGSDDDDGDDNDDDQGEDHDDDEDAESDCMDDALFMDESQ